MSPPHFEYRPCEKTHCPYSDDPHQHRTLIVDGPDPFRNFQPLSPVSTSSSSISEHSVIRRFQAAQNRRQAMARIAAVSTWRLNRIWNSMSGPLSLLRRRTLARLTNRLQERERSNFRGNSWSTASSYFSLSRKHLLSKSPSMKSESLDEQHNLESCDNVDHNNWTLYLKPVKQSLEKPTINIFVLPGFSLHELAFLVEDLTVMQVRVPDSLAYCDPLFVNHNRSTVLCPQTPEIRVVSPSPDAQGRVTVESDYFGSGGQVRDGKLDIPSRLLSIDETQSLEFPKPKEPRAENGHVKVGHLQVPERPLVNPHNQVRVPDGDQQEAHTLASERGIEGVDFIPVTDSIKERETQRVPRQIDKDHSALREGETSLNRLTKRTRECCRALMRRIVPLSRQPKTSATSNSVKSLGVQAPAEREIIVRTYEVDVSSNAQQGAQQLEQQTTLTSHEHRGRSDALVSSSSPLEHQLSDKTTDDKDVLSKVRSSLSKRKQGWQRVASLRSRRRSLVAFRGSFSFVAAENDCADSMTENREVERSISPRTCPA
ncbi:hypothetical protein GLAREA_02851 [Glarea lozoyensis ATCC 20868]|uniref:Uncharacterized protein n=1 Tax=Glarea lozoyensis (strain ATCC 20868 / MF5171) TaxID=1116229 RepID=S3CK96_GLAL2|nr:uncharacterized protein GLAREA_02851 [Glarea lozoyensis ATCC 20868]EPE26937.1 hypothetical protein GLAREA_02851 [Glarea lozoyensis ATCC 20868]